MARRVAGVTVCALLYGLLCGSMRTEGAPVTYSAYTQSDVEYELAQRHLYDFLKLGWHTVEPGRPFVGGKHLQCICEHLEAVTFGEIQNLLINVQPRSTKSTSQSVMWQPWGWLQDPARGALCGPTTRWLCGSYASSLAIRDNRRARRVIQSDWYQRAWSDRFDITSDQNEKMRFENDATGLRMAIGVGGSATGEGGDYVNFDDPQDMNKIHSEPYRKSTWRWFSDVMSTRLNDRNTSARAITMQRGHSDDMPGRLRKHIEEEPETWGEDWVELILPTRSEGRTVVAMPITGTPWERENGELLNPERQDESATARMERELGSTGTASQLQQRPVKPGGNILKREWFRFYRELPDTAEAFYDSWDTAFEEGQENDFNAGLGAITRTEGDSLKTYIVDGVHRKCELPDLLALMRVRIEDRTAWSINKYTIKYTRWLIEKKASGADVRNTLKREKVFGQLIKGVTPTTDKVSRAHAASPPIERGDVLLPDPDYVEGADWVRGFLDEVTEFPAAAHDDWTDSLTQLIIYIYKSGAGFRIL